MPRAEVFGAPSPAVGHGAFVAKDFVSHSEVSACFDWRHRDTDSTNSDGC